MEKITSLDQISNELTLIDFSAVWCGPCRMVKPNLEEINEKGLIKVFNVDVDEAVELTKEFKIEVVPTLILLKDKKTVSKKVGYMNVEEIEEWINQYK